MIKTHYLSLQPVLFLFIWSIIRQSIDVVTWSHCVATAGYKFA